MPQAAVAAVLLQHARLAFGEALGQLAAELLQRRIETRVGAPAHVASPIEHFLRTHLQNQVRMRAHEHAVARHVAQERIERRAVAVLADRIDLDEEVCDSRLTSFATPTAGSAWTWAWTSASSPKRSDTSLWSPPRSTRKCRFTAPVGS